MRSEKAGLSTAVDVDVSKRLDAFCAEIHRNRAEVMRGLLYSLLIDGKQFIFDEWRALITDGQPHPKPQSLGPDVLRARAKDAIMRAMRRSGSVTVRKLKAATYSKRISIGEWDKALQALCDAGELRVAEEPGTRGQTRKTVTLLGE